MSPRTPAVLAAVVALGAAALASTGADAARPVTLASNACAPSARALSYNDALDKLDVDGVTIGGLSSLAFDPRSSSYVSAVDNDGSQPERIWFFRNLASPKITRAPLVLRKTDGTAYTGTTADDEGLAVLPDGRFMVSSETEPSVRIFGRDGVQRSHLPVPTRFRVAPKGQATSNATLEGLTIGPKGRQVVASMEGSLSGDVSAKGDANYHRFLVYDVNAAGRWRLTRQVSYRAGAGQRIPEVARYGARGLLVEEASYSTTKGNAVKLYAVRNVESAPDVSAVTNLSAAPGKAVAKTLVANLVDCPTLGAPAEEKQANPLMDNFEGMAITSPRRNGRYGVSLISDDNFSALQSTRILNLSAELPGSPRR